MISWWIVWEEYTYNSCFQFFHLLHNVPISKDVVDGIIDVFNFLGDVDADGSGSGHFEIDGVILETWH